jgi:hypothetical protein
MIVQTSDFIGGKIKIANVAQEDVAADLQIFINDYEPEYLTYLLGADLYADLVAGLAIDPIPAKWTALVEQISVAVANYIYWFYMRDNNTQTVAMGETKGKSANAGAALPDEKLIRAWNEMVKLSYNTVQFIKDNPTDYGDYYIENFYYLGWLNDNCHRPDIFYTVNVYGI